MANPRGMESFRRGQVLPTIGGNVAATGFAQFQRGQAFPAIETAPGITFGPRIVARVDNRTRTSQRPQPWFSGPIVVPGRARPMLLVAAPIQRSRLARVQPSIGSLVVTPERSRAILLVTAPVQRARFARSQPTIGIPASTSERTRSLMMVTRDERARFIRPGWHYVWSVNWPEMRDPGIAYLGIWGPSQRYTGVWGDAVALMAHWEAGERLFALWSESEVLMAHWDADARLRAIWSFPLIGE